MMPVPEGQQRGRNLTTCPPPGDTANSQSYKDDAAKGRPSASRLKPQTSIISLLDTGQRPHSRFSRLALPCQPQGPGDRPARKIEFCFSLQADLGCPVPRTKILFFRFFVNHGLLLSRRSDQRDVSRSSRTWSGMRRTCIVPTDERHGRGWRSRVVLARPCRR